MKYILVIMGLSLFFSGCSRTIEPIPFTSPEGKQGYSLYCGKTVVNCYKIAPKICKGEYKVLDTTSQMQTLKTQYSVLNVTTYNMSIECK
ncbi:hypothetical protein [Sulfurimonas sp.]|uniref:hypothetical protein n=1 Tax=Sulfurimonas sp. TaxID=2022749 RepID=UPI003567C222